MLAYIMGESVANQASRAISSVEKKRLGIKSKHSHSPEDAGENENRSALTSNTLAKRRREVV